MTSQMFCPSPLTRRQRVLLSATLPFASLVVWAGEHVPPSGDRSARRPPKGQPARLTRR